MPAGWTRFLEHLQTAPGQVDTETRRRTFTAARYPTNGAMDEPLLAFGLDVAERSYRITAADIDKLRRAGFSEDQIFETIVVASAGAADRRLAAARRALGWS